MGRRLAPDTQQFNRRGLDTFARRWTTSGRGFFRRFLPQIVPTVDVGGPGAADDVTPLFVGEGSSISAAVPEVPTVSLTSGINTTAAIEKILVWAWARGPNPWTQADSIGVWGLAFLSGIFNPFGAAFGGFFSPQVRPKVIGGNFAGSTSFMAAGRAAGAPAPPPGPPPPAALAFQRYKTANFGQIAEPSEVTFDPPLILPAGSTLSVVNTGVASNNPTNNTSLLVSFAWREPETIFAP